MVIKSHSVILRFFVVLFGIIFGTTNALGAPDAVWLKIETDGFVIYSEAPPKEIIECALRYSAFRQIFNSLFATAGSSLPSSTLIIFRTAKSFQTHAKIGPGQFFGVSGNQILRGETLNFSAVIDGTPLNAFAWSGDRDIALSSTFEFETIWSLQRLGYAVPLGMSQGVGEVLATLSLGKGKCVVGHFGPYTYSDTLEWPQFFGVDDSSSTYHSLVPLRDFLGQSWGLMHWLLLNDGVSGEHFKAIAGRLNHMSALDAITEEMHVESAQLNKAISRHISEVPSRSMSFDDVTERARLAVVPASEAEVCVQMANLLGANGHLVESKAQLDRARILAPELPFVKEAYARWMEHEARSDESLRLYREAIASGSKNVVAYLLSATARLDDLAASRGDVAGGGGKPAELAVEELRQALKLNPGNLPALRLLGRALFVSPNIGDADVAELSQGIALEKNVGSIRYYRALIYSRLGRADESHADLLEIIRTPQLPSKLRQSAKTRYVSEVVTADAKRIQEFLNDNNYEAAREVTRSANGQLDDADLREMYKKLRSLIDQQEAKDSSKSGS